MLLEALLNLPYMEVGKDFEYDTSEKLLSYTEKCHASFSLSVASMGIVVINFALGEMSIFLLISNQVWQHFVFSMIVDQVHFGGSN